MKPWISLLISFLLIAGGGAMAHDYSRGQLWIDHPWTRPTPPGVAQGAGYMTFTNNSDHDVVLLSAQTPAADNVSIHQSVMKDGVMTMQPVTGGLVIPAGAVQSLKPHGYHLMLEGLTSPLVEGQRIPMILHFEGVSSITVELTVDALDDSHH